jgi:hypothetical protein
VAEVVVQAGHCHRRTGKIGTHREQEFTWRLAQLLVRELDAAGHQAELVTADQAVPRSDVFVALHTDGSDNRARRGASVGYPDRAGAELAHRWKLEHQRAGYSGGFLADNYTVGLREYYAFRKSRARTRFLAEHGTTTNQQDEAWLFANLDACAAAHVRAIDALFPNDPEKVEDPVLTIVHATGRASCLLRPDGTLFPLRTNDEVRAYEAAGAQKKALGVAQWDAVDAVSQRIADACGQCSDGLPPQPRRGDERTGDQQRVEHLVPDVHAADAGRDAAVGQLGTDAGLGDRVVRSRRGQGAQVALDGVDPVGGDEQQPVRGPGLAEPGVRQPPQGAGQAVQRLRRAEDRREERVLDRPLARRVLGLALREVPGGAGPVLAQRQLGCGGAVRRVEVDAPAGDAGAQLLARLAGARAVRGVGGRDGHGALLRQPGRRAA